MSAKTWYEIEAEVPANRSISKTAYWTALIDHRTEKIYRTEDLDAARKELVIARDSHEWPCRLVQCTREAIE